MDVVEKPGAPTPPTIIVQPAAEGPVVVAGNIIEALRAQPILLVVVLLNVLMVAGAVFYLLRVEAYRHAERLEILKLLEPALEEQRRKPNPVDLATRTRWTPGGRRAVEGAKDGP